MADTVVQTMTDLIASKAKWPAPCTFSRSNAMPLDPKSVFATYTEMETYITSTNEGTGGTAYPGMIIAVTNSDDSKKGAYLITSNGSELVAKKLGASTSTSTTSTATMEWYVNPTTVAQSYSVEIECYNKQSESEAETAAFNTCIWGSTSDATDAEIETAIRAYVHSIEENPENGYFNVTVNETSIRVWSTACIAAHTFSDEDGDGEEDETEKWIDGSWGGWILNGVDGTTSNLSYTSTTNDDGYLEFTDSSNVVWTSVKSASDLTKTMFAAFTNSSGTRRIAAREWTADS